MGVSLDVLEGRRPVIPSDCPREIKKMIRKCWHDDADKRPTMEAVVALLDDLIGESSAALEQEDDDEEEDYERYSGV
jgi:hypothetical protein